MSIVVYVMPGCGYCTKAKQMLSSEIANGEVVVKDMSELKDPNVNGFPHFVNPENGESVTGLVDKVELYQRLKVAPKQKEGFRGPVRRIKESYLNYEHYDAEGPKGTYATLSNVWAPQAKWTL